jgi:polysaccharide deacetylase family protein (PEP-CTERM system associated)
VTHAFTIDVEDWYQGIPVGETTRQNAERRLDYSCGRLLDLMAQYNVLGTFFILGPVAKEHPGLIRRIVEAGHEVGCHGWSHDLIYQMTPDRFRAETQQAKDAIAQVCGRSVVSYRAAYFSITRRSWWALEVLCELGFLYDSSIFPVRNWRYGIPNFSADPVRVHTPAGVICEMPLSVRRLWGWQLPVAGGAYFRLYPYWFTRANMRDCDRQNKPVIFYLHPWELDPDHPRVFFDWRAFVTHYANLGATEPRLKHLMTEFRFGRLCDVAFEVKHAMLELPM